MSVEQQPVSPESGRDKAELEALGNERLKELAESSPERAAEESPDKRAEKAREALKEQHETAPEPPVVTEQQPSRPTFVAQLDRALNFTQTMASVQRKLSPASRSFSKVIHQPAIEKTSEALENTVMRPSIAFGATWTALIVGVIFYWVSKHYGYRMSGSEMLLALLVGAVLGLVFEGIFRSIRRAR